MTRLSASPGAALGRPREPGPWRVLSVVTLGTLLLVVNLTTLNIALPVVVRHFGAGAFASSWLVLGFMLVQTSLLMVAGRMSDVFGRRGMYLCGLGVFTLSSLMAGFAPTIEALIALRVVQACGGAVLLANGTAIIAHAFPSDRLSEGLGVYFGFLTAAPLVGPSAGGFLAEAAGWQWVFWFNVPFGVIALVWAAVSLPRVPPGGDREPIDVIGAVLLCGWLSGLILTLSEGGSHGWGTPASLAGAALFAVLLPAFALRQATARHPLVDVTLFTDRHFSLANLAAFCNNIGRFGSVLLMALFLQAVSGMTPAQAGLAVLPGPIAGMVATPVGGFLGRRVNARTIAVVGSATATSGLLLALLVLNEDTPYALIAVCLILVAVGSGVFTTGNTSAVLSVVPDGRLGVVNGLRMTLLNVGNVMGAALCLMLASSALAADDRRLLYGGAAAGLSPAELGDLVTGYHRAYALLLAASVVATFASLTNRRLGRHEPRPADHG
ncbi:DHA2 family efflux MFS transporter permease subunit [Actinomadura barringtoniae]|uniref:DHA2 family efflux MFS transporter permease subunit n=1 Tax=Actinomadura barringtoniae TaxID=1427535 RepID=A0A939PEP3_9ACTN|nr:DHA2 family efflux MFS transporter permease subunit [Actinomadura barringtoniae]MBO2451260.1 DHA2 family efflux MFS transporter permease subunit [Actinomadura barringtoniae]